MAGHYIDTRNLGFRCIQLLNVNGEVEADSELLYGALKNEKGWLLVVLKKRSNNLYGFVVFKQTKDKIIFKKASEFKYLSWKTANVHGMESFKKCNKKTSKQ